MNEIFLLVGLSLSVGVFALKAGVVAVAGRFGGKAMLLLLSIYICLFAATGFAVRLIDREWMMDHLAPILRGGVLVHVLMAVGMAIWGWALLRKGGVDCAIGLVCLFVSGYFLLSLAVAPAYAKASEIYALSEQFGHAPGIPLRNFTWIAAPAIGIFAAGLWKGARK